MPYSKKQLNSIISDFFYENGRQPTSMEFNDNPAYPSPQTYSKFYGTWNKALKSILKKDFVP